MSLQVKFPYGKGHGPLHTCSDCSFQTRHRVLFERHLKRCNAKDIMNTTGVKKLPAPPVCRNYRCEKCNYTSNRARVFLFHKKRVHGENITIYVCNKCEYASKHKNKVFRHRRLVHKDALPIDNIGTLEDDPEASHQELARETPNSQGAAEPSHYELASNNGDVEEGVDMDQACFGEEDQYNLVEEDEEVSFRLPVDQEHDLMEDRENVPGGSPPAYVDSSAKAMDYVVWSTKGPGKTPIGACKFCGYKNAVKWKIANHIRSVHMKKNLFRCPHCDFVCQRKIEWCVHKTSHTKQKVHACKECSYKTTMKRNMERHTARHQQNGPYKCSYCSYSSTGEAVIQRHMAEYHSSALMEQSTPVPARVVQHPSTTRPVQKARKTGQKASFVDKSIIFNNKHPYAAPSVSSTPSACGSPASHNGSPEIACELCGLVVKTESRLRIHMVSHSNLAAWTCPLCPLSYKRPADLNRHMKRKHGVRLSDYKRKEDPEQDQPLDLCVKKEEDWEEEYNSQGDENAPLDLSKTPTDGMGSVALFKQDGVKCSYCSYKSDRASDLRRHMLVHSVEKRFRCQYCGQRYKYQAELTNHLRKYHRVSTSHISKVGSSSVGSLVPCSSVLAESMEVEAEPLTSNETASSANENNDSPAKKEDELRCKYCPYMGKYRTETERHMRLHTGEKPYQCMYCLYRTIWKGDMKRHLPKHHAAEVLKCGDLHELLDKTWNPWPESLRRTSDPDGVKDKYSEESLENFPDPMASLAALVDGGLEDPSTLQEDYLEENNNESPHKGKFESCYLGGSWEVSDNTTTETSPGSKGSPTETSGVSGKYKEACQICGHVTYPAAMKQHMEKHRNLRRFMCPDCGKRSNWAWDIKKHIMEAHQKDKNTIVELSEQEAKDTLDDYLAAHNHRAYNRTSARNTPEKENRTSDKEPSPSPLVNKQRSPSPGKVIQYTKPGQAGRYRRFKCSVCGKRSNWRWDLNKHIRSFHPAAKLVEMTEAEAKATFHEVLLRQKSPSPVRTLKESTPLRTMKEATSIPDKNVERKEAAVDRKPVVQALELPKGAPNELRISEKVDKLHLRRFKCSICPFRSNFKNSVIRHKKLKHAGSRARLVVLSTKYAMENIMPSQPRGKSPEKTGIQVQSFYSSDSGAKPIQVSSPTKSVVGESALWMCRECGHTDAMKGIMLDHVRQSHNKTLRFRCKECGHSTGYRSAIYAHLRSKHMKGNVRPFVVVPCIVRADTAGTSGADDVENMMHLGSGQRVTKPTKVVTSQPSRVFLCKICSNEFSARESILEHVKQVHPEVENPEASVEERIKPGRSVPVESYEIVPQKRPRSPGVISRGLLQCNLCPYRVNKQGLLKIHKQSHAQQPGKPYKCKYCPYYVSAARLLSQHHRLHWQEMGIRDKHFAARSPIRMTLKKTKNTAPTLTADEAADIRGARVEGKKTRYLCDKCPFVGFGLKRFLFHKQLHRPRPFSARKCSHCAFWTVSKPCLARHENLHTEAYIKANRPDLLTTPVKKMASAMQLDISNLPTVQASPCKSDISETSTDDVVEMASIKQQVIASKIASVPVTPSKLNQKTSSGLPSSAFMPSVVLGDKGQIVSSGPYRKVHKCQQCPYTNVRLASLQMHEKMHQEREPGANGKELFKCMYCTYQVGNKGLLSLHLKVHSQQYDPSVEEINDVEATTDDETKEKEASDNDTNSQTGDANNEDAKGDNTEDDDDDGPKPPKIAKFPEKPTYARDLTMHYDMGKLPVKTEYYVKFNDRTGEHVLERAVYKKWCCEKCPYATMKKSQFEKHALLHGSAQKYTCEFCDYSVPGYHLLLQHKKLHLAPNPNLLSVQSIANLQRLPVIPADVAAAGNFAMEVGGSGDAMPGTSKDSNVPLTHHESLDLFENSAEFAEPKKLYRCDRCPYTNTRRDHLLSHLKFHVMKSDLKCPFCNYSVSKVHLLNQHIKVHFNTPGCEMNAEPPSTSKDSDTDSVPKVVPPESGAQQPEFIDISELAPKLQSSDEEVRDPVAPIHDSPPVLKPVEAIPYSPTPTKSSTDAGPDKMDVESETAGGEVKGQGQSEGADAEDAVLDLSMKGSNRGSYSSTSTAVEECRYCNREFVDTAQLRRHEAQHLVGMPYLHRV